MPSAKKVQNSRSPSSTVVFLQRLPDLDLSFTSSQIFEILHKLRNSCGRFVELRMSRTCTGIVTLHGYNYVLYD